MELVNPVSNGVNQYGNRGDPGPRHLCFHPTLSQIVYTVDEQGNTVTSYAMRENGALSCKALQSVPTLPRADTPWSPRAHGADSATSEISITPDGSCLYAGNRHQQAVEGVRQSLGCFTVDAAGALTPAPPALLDHSAQAICVSPDGSTVYAAGGDDDEQGLLTVFSVDTATAALTQTGVIHPGSGPMCVRSLELPSTANL